MMLIVYVVMCATVVWGACSDEGSSDDTPSDTGSMTSNTTSDAGTDEPDGAADTAMAGEDTDMDGGGEPFVYAAGAPFDYCNDQPPDAACYQSKRDPNSATMQLARAIGDAVLERDPTELRWDWGEAAMMIGLWNLALATGEERYLDFIQAWMDHHIGRGYSISTSDTCASAALAIALLEDGRSAETYTPVVEDALSYLREDALRVSNGGLSHFGTLTVFGIELWADSLFMFGNVFTRWGELEGEQEALDEYTFQYEAFAELMQDADSGFFIHAAESQFEQESDVYWARANGWIVGAGYDHLRVRRNLEQPLPEMARIAREQVAGVIDTQDPDTGLWWTVINRPGETYLETSASALFIYGMARGWRYGYLGDEVLPAIALGLQGVTSRILDADGNPFDPAQSMGAPVVTGTSQPTSVGTFDYYANIMVEDDIPYGIGAVLLALTESSGLPLSE
ncbi:MAG: glycoside hydrolase family 88 protein [Myxococcota bacterium]